MFEQQRMKKFRDIILLIPVDSNLQQTFLMLLFYVFILLIMREEIL